TTTKPPTPLHLTSTINDLNAESVKFFPLDYPGDFFKTYIDSRFYAGHKLDFKQQNCAGGPGSGGGVVGNNNNSHPTAATSAHLSASASAPLHGLAAHTAGHQSHHSLLNSHHALQQHQQQQQQQQHQTTPSPSIQSNSAPNNPTSLGPLNSSSINTNGNPSGTGTSSPSTAGIHPTQDTHSSSSVPPVATSLSAPSLPHIAPTSLGLSPQSSADSQQFNIFPAIFSRQLNFSAAAGGCGQSKLTMDELRPNLVGGLLGLQQGLLEDHAASMQHAGSVPQDTKFMSFQDNRLMGIGSSHENRLLGLSSSVQDSRSPAAITSMDKNPLNHQRKCSSTPEDFSSLYSGLPTPGIDSSSHHHTPAHTPPTRLSDHTIS
ncbi:muscle segmentation homeobox-like, partial [Musca vetustissima]|uniref:muscle segmentation homeobox-like n=1 Tax=Musca vetustissima TaxID=27455 RepID=UPI002AB70F23